MTAKVVITPCKERGIKVTKTDKDGEILELSWLIKGQEASPIHLWGDHLLRIEEFD